MTKIIEWDGEPFAVLVESSTYGNFLVPPIVLDPDGRPIEGRDLLTAVVMANTRISVPVLRNATPAVLAEVDRRMARLSDQMGVPLWPSP